MPWFNAPMKWLLQSPLHGLVSQNTLLLTYTGRKSGVTYSHPVDYEPEGDTILIFTKKTKNWWKNLKGGAPVTMLIAGQTIHGVADIPEITVDQCVAGLRKMYPLMAPAQAAQIAPETVLVRVNRKM